MYQVADSSDLAQQRLQWPWYSVQLSRGDKADDGWRETWVMHQIAADAKGRKQAVARTN